MRASISGDNSSSRVKLSMLAAETAWLLSGLDSRAGYKLSIEGDVVSGLRISAGDGSYTPKQANDCLWIDMKADDIQAAHEPVCQADLVVKLDRDDNGPIILCQPFPLPFVPKPRRASARVNLEHFERANAELIAERLFKGTVTVKKTHKDPVPWTYSKSANGGSHSARLECDTCENVATVGLNTSLPDEVIKKKFLQQHWHMKGTKGTCPDCQKAGKALPRPAVDIGAVIDNTTRHLTERGKVEQLEIAMADVNRLMEEINDPKVKLRIVKNRLDAYRECKLTGH